MTASRVPICWLLSMTRSGSSAAAYASSHALGALVLDEPFGPWDRTAPPYRYPNAQPELHRRHLAAGEILSAETSEHLDKLIEMIICRQADRPSAVIIKVPHSMIDPRDIARLRPDDRIVYMLRNPLERLNSLYTRGWQATILTPHDLETFRQFAHRWIAAPPEARLTFDALIATPRMFFRACWDAWELPWTEARVEDAVRYRAQEYHESSAIVQRGRNPHRVLSRHRKDVPIAAVHAYLRDPVALAFFARFGWSTAPSAYSGHR
ncbi:MAG: hypothetical protein AAGB48_03725 [Planctomycetota bacterium]